MKHMFNEIRLRILSLFRRNESSVEEMELDAQPILSGILFYVRTHGNVEAMAVNVTAKTLLACGASRTEHLVDAHIAVEPYCKHGVEITDLNAKPLFQSPGISSVQEDLLRQHLVIQLEFLASQGFFRSVVMTEPRPSKHL